MDVTPTVLRLFGLDVPADLQGRVIEAVAGGVAAARWAGGRDDLLEIPNLKYQI